MSFFEAFFGCVLLQYICSTQLADGDILLSEFLRVCGIPAVWLRWLGCGLLRAAVKTLVSDSGETCLCHQGVCNTVMFLCVFLCVSTSVVRVL
jgi:hypothetical protein